jgi:hypothetical protein
MTDIRQISDSTTAVLQANDNFKAVSAAGLYGYNAFTTTGLFFGYYGGRAFGNTIADSAVLLTASTTNYIVANRTTGAVTAATTTTNWNDTSNYLKLFSVVTGASSITSYVDERQAYGGTGSGGGSFTGGTLSSALNEAPQVTIASAGTVAIGAAAANTVLVSGTTTITAFDTIAAGAIRRVRFLGALTLTYSGTSLILPGAANITTAAGDVATMESLGSGNWRCIDYAKADGTALVGGGGGGSGTVTSVDASGGVETVSGSPITASGAIRTSVAPNAQVATTYTVVTGDRGKLVTFNNASPVAVTLPQAISTFGSGWYFFVKNLGAGNVTITPTTSTIGGGATLILTTGQGALILSDGTNYQTLFTSASSTLANWTEAVNSASPNTTVPVVSFTVSNAATNVDAAITPKGTGALVGVPSSGSVNKRGSNAIDFQLTRSAGTMIASGGWATLVGGNNNTASGAECFSGGGTTNANSGAQGVLVGGSTNTLSAIQGVVVGGSTNNSSADYAAIGGGFGNLASGIHSSIPGGRQASTRGLTGMQAHASGRFGTTGDAQAARYVLRRQTTTATTSALSADGSAPGSATSIVLPNNAVYAFEVLITAKVTTFGDRATYKITGQVSRNASAAATAIDGTPTVTTIAAIGGASAWTVTAVANTTLGSLEIQVTGAAATTINWVARVETVETTA